MAKKLWTLALAGVLAGSATTAMADVATVHSKWGTTTIQGKTYLDGSYINYRKGGTKQSSSGAGFDLKRFYLTFNQQFNKMFSARFRTDVEKFGGASGHPNAYSVYVKNAWVKAKFNNAFALEVGLADMPWIPYVEGLYGYRYVEHTLADRTHYATSADLGVQALGKLANGKIDYQLAVVNGSGYHNLHRSKTVDFSGRVGFHPTNHITFAIGGKVGKRGQGSYGTTGTFNQRTASRLDGVLAYVSNSVRVGASGFWANNYQTDEINGYYTNSLGTKIAAPSDKAYGVSAWASYVLPMAEHQWSVFARYDYVRPHNSTDPGMKDQYANAGVQYQPIKPLKLALVYKYDRFSQGSVDATQAGYSGANFNNSGLTAGQHSYYSEIGVFGQYLF